MSNPTTLPAAQWGPIKVSAQLQCILSLIGFTSVIAQIVLMRELIVVFYGNEISLGIMLAGWLLWTALGSSLLGKVSEWFRDSCKVMAGLEILLAMVFPLTIFAVRASRLVFQSVPGEILGPGPMFLTSLATLSMFCLLSGALFAGGSRLCSDEARTSRASAASSVYMLEAVGSGLGGVLAGLVLIRYFTSFEVAGFLALLNCLAAAWVGIRALSYRRLAMALLLVAAVLLPRAARWLEAKSLALLWQGFSLMESRNSIYGNLALVATSESRSLFENGLRILTVPDPSAAEEAVHFALLEHPAPRSTLLIGGGINGSLAQALQYSRLERVDYVELDPAILGVAERYFAGAWTRARNDPRVFIHPVDGRLFLKTSKAKFDVIIVNLPDPFTAQLNRFYTQEFFLEAAEKLNPGGVLSFQVTGEENYISQELADLLRCLQKSLRSVFPQVAAIPGETVHFLASNQAGSLTLDPSVLMSRLRERRIHTQYFREYYIPFRMSPDRSLDLQLQIEPQAATPINRDFTPIAYYFDVVLWSSRFHSHWRDLLESLAGLRFAAVARAVALGMLGLALVAALYERLRMARHRETAHSSVTVGLCVVFMGFTLLGLEVFLLLGFQALYGYVYQQLAILVALFMVGMASGAWLALRNGAAQVARASRPLSLERPGPAIDRGQDPRATAGETPALQYLQLACLQLLAGLSPLLLCVLFLLLERVRNLAALLTISPLVFPVLALMAGMMGGYQFPLANRIYFAGVDASSGVAQTSGSEVCGFSTRYRRTADLKTRGPRYQTELASGRNPGVLYGLDLLGACLGAVLLSAYLLPVYGFLRTAMLMAVVNLAPAALAALAALEEKIR